MTMLADYEPPATGDWARVDARRAGFDPEALAAAVAFAEANETPWERNMAVQIQKGHFEAPPWNEIIGPVKDRGGPSGLVVRGGRIAAQWGDPGRVDMTFSASKSYLSVCAGLAFDAGLLPDPHEPVRKRVDDGGFEGPQNGPISWHHLLQMTSEWEGELWGKPEQIDRWRDLDTEGANSRKGQARPLQAPGSYWEYNDVRVNRLALALLRLWRRGLPELIREKVMGPIGCSSSWQWHGYRNSWVEIDGRQVQSVSGGGHWGGGFFIDSYDHARVGLLMLRQGRWGGRQLLSREWIARSLTPCDLKATYGYMWWLNTGRAMFKDAPESGFCAVGAGSNIVWIDPANDLVVVMRWIARPAVNGLLDHVYRALRG